MDRTGIGDVRLVTPDLALLETSPSVRVLGKSGFVYDSVVVSEGVGTTWRFRHDRDVAA